MLLKIRHKTEYQLETQAQFILQEIRMTPPSSALQSVRAWSVDFPGGALEASFDDQHGNPVRLFSVSGRSAVSVVCEGLVETFDRAGVFGPHRAFAPLWLYSRETALTAAGAGVAALVNEVGPGADGAIESLHRLNAIVAATVRYEIGSSAVQTNAEAALEAGRGVCQDHAHVFCAAARAMGFPARYVSGYLMMPDREDQEASHAWAEAHVAGLGWVGFDPANGQSPDARYVRLAVGLDYAEAAPVIGLRRGAGGEILVVSVEVQQQ